MLSGSTNAFFGYVVEGKTKTMIVSPDGDVERFLVPTMRDWTRMLERKPVSHWRDLARKVEVLPWDSPAPTNLYRRTNKLLLQRRATKKEGPKKVYYKSSEADVGDCLEPHYQPERWSNWERWGHPRPLSTFLHLGVMPHDEDLFSRSVELTGAYLWNFDTEEIEIYASGCGLSPAGCARLHTLPAGRYASMTYQQDVLPARPFIVFPFDAPPLTWRQRIAKAYNAVSEAE